MGGAERAGGPDCVWGVDLVRGCGRVSESDRVGGAERAGGADRVGGVGVARVRSGAGFTRSEGRAELPVCERARSLDAEVRAPFPRITVGGWAARVSDWPARSEGRSAGAVRCGPDVVARRSPADDAPAVRAPSRLTAVRVEWVRRSGDGAARAGAGLSLRTAVRRAGAAPGCSLKVGVAERSPSPRSRTTYAGRCTTRTGRCTT